MDYSAGQVPLGQVGETDEIGKAAVFLACDDNNFVNGVEPFDDGGMAQVCFPLGSPRCQHLGGVGGGLSPIVEIVDLPAVYEEKLAAWKVASTWPSMT